MLTKRQKNILFWNKLGVATEDSINGLQTVGTLLLGRWLNQGLVSRRGLKDNLQLLRLLNDPQLLIGWGSYLCSVISRLPKFA